ncbi:MAG: hypothetical protein ACT4PE_06445 [Candidatus Eiseniibacteriota bacterium]
MRPLSLVAGAVAVVALSAAPTGASARDGVEPASSDSLGADVAGPAGGVDAARTALEHRFSALEAVLAAARLDACPESGGGEVRCLEAEALAEVAEELLQEGEFAVAVVLLEEAVALLGAPAE